MTPAKVQFATSTMPVTAVKFEQEAKVPPEADNEIAAPDDVTILPAESSIDTTGSAIKADPEVPDTG